MKFLLKAFLFSGRVILASIFALSLQIFMIVRSPEHLLLVQEKVKSVMPVGFGSVELDSQYRVAYNFIGGDNILVHTLFVLLAYLSIMLISALCVGIYSYGKKQRNEPT
ncbi:MAG: hypothetical protein GKR96_02595 [Gammaproteobacteria bacterium]|nr:hypothetical protein [Gammaproteobacteria bacterium]